MLGHVHSCSFKAVLHNYLMYAKYLMSHLQLVATSSCLPLTNGKVYEVSNYTDIQFK